MSTPINLEATRKEVARLSAVLQNARYEEQRAANQALVGRYFKFRNSYGSGKKWWLYLRVDSIDDVGGVHATQFEVDPQGRVRIEFDNFHTCLSTGDGWREITADIFNAALVGLKEKVNSL